MVTVQLICTGSFFFPGCFVGKFNNESSIAGDVSATTSAGGEQTILKYGGTSETLYARSCEGPFQYIYQREDGTPVAAYSDRVISLNSMPTTLELYSDTLCSAGISPRSIRIQVGASESAGFYLKSSRGDEISFSAPWVDTNGNSGTAQADIQFVGPVESVSIGYQGGCAVHASGRLICWGINFSGNNGAGSSNSSDDSKAFVKTGPGVELQNVVQVNRGNTGHTCALTASSTYCWGSNSDGQLGIGTFDNSSHEYATLIAGAGLPSSIETGNNVTCMRNSSGDVSCWGSDANGRLGQTAGFDTCMGPGCVSTIGSTTSMGYAYLHGCALLSDETVKCWGYSGSGEAGNAGGGGAYNEQPQTITGAVGVLGLAVGYQNNCVILKPDNHVSCFGEGSHWVNGTSSTSDSITVGPEIRTSASAILSGVSKVAVGKFAACAVKTDGTVWCWGGQHNSCSGGMNCGELGNSNMTGSIYATEVPYFSATGTAPKGVTDIYADEQKMCALRHGDLYCWGSNMNNSLGIPGAGSVVVSPQMHQYWP